MHEYIRTTPNAVQRASLDQIFEFLSIETAGVRQHTIQFMITLLSIESTPLQRERLTGVAQRSLVRSIRLAIAASAERRVLDALGVQEMVGPCEADST